MLTLESFPLPQEIVDKGVEGIVTTWKQSISRAAGKKRAIRLMAAAKDSIGLTEGLMMAKQEITSLLAQYKALEQEIDNLMIQIENILKEIPGTAEMMSIPGVGMVTVAGFISEVGNLEGYRHPRQIQKLAGLNLKENSSGKHKGQTRITKRGRPRLRALLYKCIMPLVAKNHEFKVLHHYYTTRAKNPLKKKQSLIALCCKLIRVLFALGKKRIPYDGKKLLTNPLLSLVQEAA